MLILSNMLQMSSKSERFSRIWAAMGGVSWHTYTTKSASVLLRKRRKMAPLFSKMVGRWLLKEMRKVNEQS